MTTKPMKFIACGPGITPKFKTTEYITKFREWQHMRAWCEEQDWVLGQDYMASGRIEDPWYFKNSRHQMWFSIRWAA